MNRSVNPATGDGGAQQVICSGWNDIANSLPTEKAQAIIAELIGSNTCTAAGVTVVDHAPVFALSRALLKAGQNPNRPLHAYRGGALCLRVRSIGQAAQLTVEDDRHGRPRLRRWRDRARGCGAAPPAHRRCER